MPPIKAKTQKAGLNTQTFSIPKSCQKIEDVIPFLEFLVSRENMTRLALADWMMPTRESCLESPVFNTVDDGWKVVTTSAQYLSTGPWVGLPGYTEWKLRVANPVFQELFSNRITVQEAAQRIERESQSVFMRYQMRDMQW
jgi:ABC-type glycerol-3-phosphate transport system substrate-binding protein